MMGDDESYMQYRSALNKQRVEQEQWQSQSLVRQIGDHTRENIENEPLDKVMVNHTHEHDLDETMRTRYHTHEHSLETMGYNAHEHNLEETMGYHTHE